MDESWKPVSGFESYYLVSTYGNVRSLDRACNHKDGTVTRRSGRLLKLSLRAGYPFVHLCSAERRYQAHVHRLVAEAFIARPEGCNVVNHIDGNKLNNRTDNLEWTTFKGNAEHAARTGLFRPAKGESAAMSLLTEEQVLEIRKRLSIGERGSHLAREYGVKPMCISQIRTGRSWAHSATQDEINACKRASSLGLKGSSHPGSKLNEHAVREIIQLLYAKTPQKDIASRLGCSTATVSLINMGSQWGSVRVDGCGDPPYYRRRPRKTHLAIGLRDSSESQTEHSSRSLL